MQFCFTIVPNFAVAHSRTIVSCGLRRRCADFSRWLLYDIKISILTGLRVSPGARAPGAHMTGAPVAIKLSGPSLRRRRSHQSSNSKNHILIRNLTLCAKNLNVLPTDFKTQCLQSNTSEFSLLVSLREVRAAALRRPPTQSFYLLLLGSCAQSVFGFR